MKEITELISATPDESPHHIPRVPYVCPHRALLRVLWGQPCSLT